MFQMASLSLFLPFSLFLSPLLPPSSSLCPSVMALVHPHVYLYYKAEESGRLKMKTSTRERLCAHFVNANVWHSICEYALFYPFRLQASFLNSRVEFLCTSPPTTLLFSQPPCCSHLLLKFQPRTGGCFFFKSFA